MTLEVANNILNNETIQKETTIEPKIEEAIQQDNNNNNEEPSTVSDIEFPDLMEEVAGKKIEEDVFSNIPINVAVELGQSKVSLKEVFELTEGSIIELERLVGEPLDLVVNGQVVAQGEVVAIDNNYGLRVTHIVSNFQT